MSDVDLIINVHTNGIKDITNLSAATRALALNLRGITVPMTKLDAHSRAVSKALGMTNRSMNDHAKSVKQMVANQKALGAETKRVQSNIKSYAMAIQSAGGTHTVFGRELIQSRNELKAFSSTLRGLRIRAFGSDLASISLKLQRIGKDAQFVGRSLMINLTAPILLFARMGFQSLLKVDEQLVRLTKVLEGVAMSTDQANLKLADYVGPDKQARIKQMTDSFIRLNTAITESSTKFGVAKDLVAGLAVDFAELGITANENIVALTNLTLAAEKLGSMDASGAQDLASALYFNATRAYEVAGAFDNVTSAADRESKAIASATVQLNMFNTIENVTALSLKDLADSLPELGGMALSFGLSMTEAAALLAPMKAAGFDVGASANSIKVSLQRAIVPTKQNVELLARLSKQYGATGKSGNAFSESTKTGLTGLQAIVDIFGKVVDGGRNTEAGLKLMSDLFEKRQGPRMYIAIEQLNQFDKALKNVNNNQSPERMMAGAAESALAAFNKLNGTSLPETITQFSDIGVVARIAASEVGAMVDGFTGKGAGGSITQKEKEGAIAARKAVADLIKQKKLNEDVDLISEVKTQSGRAMLVELAGASSAQDVANMELQQSLNSLSAATQRIKIAFKNFAADIIRYTAPTLKKFSDFITNFYRKWQNLSESTRERISKLILGFLGFLAALAPVILALGTMQASVGVLGRGITFFLPKLKNMEGGLVGIAGGAKKATKAMTDMYNSFVGKKQLSSIVPSFLPASGSAPLQGMIGTPTRVGRNITLPGNVLPTPQSLFDADGNPLTGAARARVIASNRAASVSHAARGRLDVNQYLRNEGSILSSQGMRVNARGRVVDSSGRFVGGNILGKVSQASVLREAALTDAGISRTAAGGARLATKTGFKDISEGRALRIARGGIAGQIARRTADLDGIGGRFTSATGVTGRGFLRGMLPTRGGVATGAGNIRGLASAAFNAGPVAAYTKSVQGAKAAVQAMKIEQMALGGSAGTIRTMTTAMGGFMKSTKLGTIALKLMKVALISSGIGAIMLGIGVAVYIIVKNFDKFKDKASGAILRVKNAWAIFKEAIMMIIQPFVNLFAMLDGGSKKGGDAVGGLAKAFDGIGKVLQKVAQWFKMLVENFIQPYLYMIIDIVMFVVSIFQGNWGKAFDFLVAAVSGAAKLVIKLFAALLKAAVWITAGGIKLVIGYFTLIPKAVAKAFSWLENLPFVGGIFGGISDGINAVVDSLYGLVDAGKNAANGVIDAVADAAVGLLDKGVSKGVSGAAGKISNDPKVPAAAEKAGEEAGEIMGNSFGNGFEDSDASGKIAKSISEGINDAIQQLQDYVAGELGNALSKFVDESVKALEKQKTSALKVFDVQIKTLGKLEKAEESLTKKKEYETNRRKIIDNQALSNEQFRRNYALAVYEGRIDDARMLQLQQSADEKGFSQDLLTIEQERARDLAKENLDALKEAINEAKDAASLFFEESITKFQESAALITKIAPVTVEQYTEQLNQLQQLTETNATNMNTTFGSMFEAFATTIADKMPNKVVGPFATNLDELVLTAKEKFGLGSDKSENTVIGITLGMLSEVGATFGDGKQSVIDSFGTITTGIATNFSEMKTKFLEEVKSDFIKNFKAALDAAEPTKVFNQAIIDGNLSILRSFQNMVDVNPALMEKLKKSLDPAIEGYIKLKAAADAAKDAAGAAADAAAGGGGDGTSGTTGSSKPAGTYAGTSRLDAFVKNNELRAARSLRALTYQEFIGNYKGFKKGGIIPSRAQNQNQGYPEGFIPAPTQEGVPTLLHGGEYILNAKAVQRIGVGALNKMNNNLIPKFIKGGVVPGGKNKKGDGTLNGPYGTVVKPVVPGNINLKTLPVVKNNIPNEGGVSTVRSISVGVDKGTMLIPTVVNGKILSDQQAIKSAIDSGKNLGIYKNNAAAEMAAQLIHLSEANRVGKMSASNTRGTADRVEQQIKKIADEPYNWKKDRSLNFVEKAIFKASDFAIGTGKFAANTAIAVGETGVVGAMSLYNAALGLMETAIPSKSQNPLKNIAARQNDLLYGTGASIPFVPRKYGQLTTVGKPYSVTMNELKAYERMSGESIPGWKKTAYALAGDRAIMDAIGIATMGGGSFVNSAVKTGVARAATSKLGTSILTATLGEGGAAALSGTLTSAAEKAGAQRLATVLSNKNLLGRIQSSYAAVTGGAKTPVAPELIGLNNLYDPTGAIKQTFGKAPSTLIADVLNGRMVLPEGGFTPKFGSIGTGSFIDTTLAGSPSSSIDTLLAVSNAQVRSSVEPRLDFSSLVKIGEKQGFNPGGLYESPSTKLQYYVKQPTSQYATTQELIENELLANALYRELGVATTNLKTIMTDNGPALISEIIPKASNLNSFTDQLSSPDYIKLIQKDFAVDAWLGNYDVIGWDTPNILNSESGVPVRIDAGGSLKFTGTGKTKMSNPDAYTQFTNIVGELKSMTTDPLNHGSYLNASKVFGSMSPEDMAASAQKLKLITPEKITEIAHSTISDNNTALNYAALLIKRREYILEQLLGNRSAGAVPTPSIRLTEVTQDPSDPFSWIAVDEVPGMNTPAASSAVVKKPGIFKTAVSLVQDKYASVYDKFYQNYLTRTQTGYYSAEEIFANRESAGLPKLPSYDMFGDEERFYKSTFDKYGNPILPRKPLKDPLNPYFSKVARPTIPDLLEKIGFRKPDVESEMMANIFNVRQRFDLDEFANEIMSSSNEFHDLFVNAGVDLNLPSGEGINNLLMLRKASLFESQLGYLGKYTKAYLRLKYPNNVVSNTDFEDIIAASAASLYSNPSLYDQTFQKQYPMFSVKTGRGSRVTDKTTTGFATQIAMNPGLYNPESPIIDQFRKVITRNQDSKHYIPDFVLDALTKKKIGIPGFTSPFQPGSANPELGMMQAALFGGTSASRELKEALGLMLSGKLNDNPDVVNTLTSPFSKRNLAFAALRSIYPEAISPNAELYRLATVLEQIGEEAKYNPNFTGDAYGMLGNYLIDDFNTFLVERIKSQASFLVPDFAMGNFDQLTKSLVLATKNRNLGGINDILADSYPAAYTNIIKQLQKPSPSQFYNTDSGLAAAGKQLGMSNMDYVISDMSKPLSSPIKLFSPSVPTPQAQSSLPSLLTDEWAKANNPSYGGAYGRVASSDYSEAFRGMNLPYEFLQEKGLLNWFEASEWKKLNTNGMAKKLFTALMKFRMESQQGYLSGRFFSLPTDSQYKTMDETGASFLETIFNETASTASEAKSLPFRMATDNVGIVQSLLEMLGLPNPSGRATANTGDVLDMADIWDFEDLKFPLSVIPKVEKTNLYEQVVGKLTPGEIGIHKGAIPGLSQIKPPSTVDANIDTNKTYTGLYDHLTTFKPIQGYPLLKGAAYTFSAGQLYLARAFDFLESLLATKKAGDMSSFVSLVNNIGDATEGIRKTNFESLYAHLGGDSIGNPILNNMSALFGYDPITQMKEGNLPVTASKVLFGSTNSSVAEFMRTIFSDPTSGYIVRMKSEIPDPEGWQGTAVVSQYPDVIARWQKQLLGNDLPLEKRAELQSILNSLLDPNESFTARELPRIFDASSLNFAEVLKDRLDESVIQEIHNSVERSIQIKGAPDKEQYNLLLHKKSLEFLQEAMNAVNPKLKFYGGKPTDTLIGQIPGYKVGGYVPGSPSMPVPAILHGGEYVVNANAVRNMGLGAMQRINQSRFTAPSGAPMYAGGGQTTNVSTVNINVDTFIGEEEWFKGMMRDYNINVLPKQQKASGLESRTFTSYNGIQGF